ncbi:hypothetical protein AGLY_004162 [Aphis glycines]|uniref:Uncharacterized protein n=1 Tax=Aphis glycines TaxID=307491 RepID=A0A6G0TZR4_APHGL|nr:hypothetical protein AGLY_004162 [Aphis glycines]
MLTRYADYTITLLLCYDLKALNAECRRFRFHRTADSTLDAHKGGANATRVVLVSILITTTELAVPDVVGQTSKNIEYTYFIVSFMKFILSNLTFTPSPPQVPTVSNLRNNQTGSCLRKLQKVMTDKKTHFIKIFMFNVRLSIYAIQYKWVSHTIRNIRRMIFLIEPKIVDRILTNLGLRSS